MKILGLEEVSYSHEGKEILKSINLEVKKGDCLSIVGSSGSGKSTLLRLIADLISPTQGNIYFEDQSYRSYAPTVLRKKISYCLQLPTLFGTYVKENLIFPFEVRKEQVDKARIDTLLDTFQLERALIDKPVCNLSGGEKQRIAMIRNLLYEPEILLLDEATSALDLENAQRVEAYVKALNQRGVTVLWVTHQKEQSEGIFNKRLHIAEGNLVEVEVLRT